MKVLTAEIESELQRFEQEIAALENGALDPNDFKRFRLENGVYGIRNSEDRHMIRVKIPHGRITPDQLDEMADLAEQFTPTGISHFTTRQDIQFHNVRRSDVPRVLRRIAEAGLTTREACGNTVRNVTACPYAGVSSGEAFDVTPYAEAVAAYFLRNPINQNMPRKFKIAFEGCHEDHARIPIHDIGAVAKTRIVHGREERGFHLYFAGGLGAQPRSADRLEEFTPADLLVPTIEAAIRVFDRYGERRPERVHRMRARMKFLARQWGSGKLQKAIIDERKQVLLTRSGRMPLHIVAQDELPPEKPSLIDRRYSGGADAAYTRWRAANVREQKQSDWHVVSLAVPLGDIAPAPLRSVAQIARRYCAGRLRISIDQNLILRWVSEEALPHVFAELRKLGLAQVESGQITDITRCPGADTCQLALTHSRALAVALQDSLRDRYRALPEIMKLSIKISGCMNSCGQHHIADIGLFGASLDADGKAVPVYTLLLGGGTSEGRATFGKIVGKVPARLAPEAVRTVLDCYAENRFAGEDFPLFLDRFGISRFRELLGPFMDASALQGHPELHYDLGEVEEYKAEIGVGECAS
jgi:sulfite reductase beta subunit-like hemoprotein